MNKTTLSKTLLLFVGPLFVAGCQTGGEKLADKLTLTHQANTVVQAKVAQPNEPTPSTPAASLPAPTETSAVTAATLAAARTETVHRGPALITLAAGDDIQQYFDGSHRRVILDFYADWCGPCKMVAPVLEELSQEYDGKVDIYKIDTEKEQELAGAFGISSIPSIL